MSDLNTKAATKAAKPKMHLLPWTAVRAVAHVMTFGALKYEPNSWREAPFHRDMYLDAMLRHVVQLSTGEVRDAESGMLHASHIATNALFLLWYELRDAGTEC